MLTITEVRVLHKLFSICSKIHITPIHWDKTRTKISISKTCQQSTLFALTCCIVLGLLADNAYRMRVNIKKRNYDFFVIYGIASLAHSCAIVCKILIFKYGEEFVYLMNQILMLNEEQDKRNPAIIDQNTKQIKFRSRLFKITSIYLYIVTYSFITVFLGIMYIKIFKKCGDPILCHGLFVLFASATILTWLEFIPTVIMFFQSSLAALIFVKFWLHMISVEWPVLAQKSVENFDVGKLKKQLEGWIKLHKMMFLLNSLFNKSFGQTLLPFFQNALTFAIWFTVYAIIILGGNFNLFSFFVLVCVLGAASGVLAVLLVQMSVLYDEAVMFKINTKRLLYRFENRTIRGILERDINCQLLIKCQIGELYYMESKAKLTTIHNIVNGIVFMLVSAKK